MLYSDTGVIECVVEAAANAFGQMDGDGVLEGVEVVLGVVEDEDVGDSE